MAEVDDYTALISGYSWNGMTSDGSAVFITYCFRTNANVPSLADYQPYANDGYSEFTAEQKQNFRDAVEKLESISGIKMIEVSDPEDSSIDVMNTSGSGYGGWANYGVANSYYTSDGYLVVDGSGAYNPGSYEFETILHELGHAMGLKHPFEGDPVLPSYLPDPNDVQDNEDHTLMSYTSNGYGDTDFAHLDVDAFQHLYGTSNNIKGSWSWSWSDATREFTLNGSNGADKLIGTDTKTKIYAKGGNDKIFGRDSRDIIKAGGGDDLVNSGSGDDRISGGKGKDDLRGGDGNDIIAGGKQNDVLEGGWGNDTFVFKKKDGKDKIKDFSGWQDKIDLSGFGYANKKQALKHFYENSNAYDYKFFFKDAGTKIIIKGDNLYSLEKSDIII